MVMAAVCLDTRGARALLPIFLLPAALAQGLLAAIDSPVVIYFFMFIGGLGGGLFGIVQSVLWVELYGTKHLGAIRSMIMACLILSSALAYMSTIRRPSWKSTTI